jgi:hypothetical protein
MASVVIVTTAALDEATLAGIVDPGDVVHIVVPAVGQTRMQWLTNAEDEPRDEAAAIAERVGDATPARTTTEENRDPPSQAVVDAVRKHRPDRVVVLLHKDDEATWLESGELERIPDTVEGVPIERRTL